MLARDCHLHGDQPSLSLLSLGLMTGIQFPPKSSPTGGYISAANEIKITNVLFE